jgi:hypothetical protein
MSTALLWLAAATLIVWVLTAFEIVRGNARIAFLRDVAPLPPAGLPRVSVVIAARDEERNIEAALQSVL